MAEHHETAGARVAGTDLVATLLAALERAHGQIEQLADDNPGASWVTDEWYRDAGPMPEIEAAIAQAKAAVDSAALAPQTVPLAGVVPEEVRRVLQPFADAWNACESIGEQGGGYVQEDNDVWVGGRSGSRYPLFKFGDLRRVHALLSQPTATGEASGVSSGAPLAGTGSHPSGEAAVASSSQGDVDPSRGPLLAKAREQVAYWQERQRHEKSLEDGLSEDGETYTPIGDEAAWQGGYCNGWYSSSVWWLQTISALLAPSHESIVAEMGRQIERAHAELARVFPPKDAAPAGTAGTPDTPDPQAPQETAGGLPTDNLMDRFSAVLKEKLRAAEAKHGWQDGWANPDWQPDCQRELLRHVAKGDPIDVAAYAAFCWHHGWPTAAPPPVSPPTTQGGTETLREAAVHACDQWDNNIFPVMGEVMSNLRAALGYQPATPVAEGLREALRPFAGAAANWDQEQNGGRFFSDAESVSSGESGLIVGDLREARRALAAPAQPDQGVGWQPIETAPKDGTPVDLWVEPYDAFESGNAGRVPDAEFVSVGWRRYLSGRWWAVSDCGTATHWMLRPAAPSLPSQTTDRATRPSETEE